MLHSRVKYVVLQVCVVLGISMLALSSAHAAEYAVKPDGSGHFRTIQACANTARPGDTCLVSAGIYPEHVSTFAGGIAGSPVTFKANGTVTMKGFRIQHPYVVIHGFDITKYDVGLDQGHIRVEPEGDNCQIVNNVIRDGIYLSSTRYMFDAAAKTITNPGGGFFAAGFVPGVSIYIGSDINNQILNHDNNKGTATAHIYETKIVRAVTDTVLTLDAGNTVFTEGPVPATIYVNTAEKNGVWGILFIDSTARGVANDCLIQGNRFSNLAGKGLHLLGNNHLVQQNTFERMNGWRMFSFVGSNNVFRHNVFRNSPRWPGFFLPKTTLASQGSGTWDMYDVFMASFGGVANNNVIEFNFVEGIDEQFSNITEASSSGLIIRNNLFVGYEMSGSISRPGTQIVNNTFYKSAWNASLHNFTLATSSIGGNPVGSVITDNVFVETARASEPTSGWYSTIGFDGKPTAGVAADYNFVAGAASLGYPAKTGFKNYGLEVHGINGGDPKFQNASNLLGADGIPFTLDDGLKPLTTSPLCGKGAGGTDIGAYSCDPKKVFAESGPEIVPPPLSTILPILPPRPPTNPRILR
jgi:hypothetical protein